MAYTAKVFRILIASPSDVSQEREIVSRVIQEWNDLYSFEKKVVLLPLKWETHSAPEMNIRPQEVINKEVVDFCDMAIGVFWTRIGSPTGKFASGTMEEIDRVGKAEKIVMLYFSQAKIDPENIDLEQLKKLREFRTKSYPDGLIEQYTDVVEFRDKLTKQLEIKLRSLINRDLKLINNESLELSTTPKLELGFYDVFANSFLQKEITINSKILTIKNIDKVPDYKKKKNEEIVNKDSVTYMTIMSEINKDYYRNYLEYLKTDWFFKPLQFYLFNSSQIGIRDIFIEIKIKKDTCISLRNKPILIPKRENEYLFSTRAESEVKGIDIKEDNEMYILNMSYDALQPQRKINMDLLMYIGSTKNTKIECKARIYADCFPQPFEELLTVKLVTEKIEVEASQLIKELDI